MGSLRFDGIRFMVYTMDHAPRHVHGFYAELEVIVDLRPDGSVSPTERMWSDRVMEALRMCAMC